MIRRPTFRERRAAALAQQAAASLAAKGQQAEQSRRILAEGEPLEPAVFARTVRYNSEGFTLGQLQSIRAPLGSQRVQLVINQPGYGKNGFRSTGWIDVTQVDLGTLEEDFGIQLTDLRGVVFDTAG